MRTITISISILLLCICSDRTNAAANSSPAYDVECDHNYSCGIFNPLLSTKQPSDWTFDGQHTGKIKKFETKVQLRLKTIPQFIFDNYINLITLKLEECGIDMLPDHRFAKSKVLKNLVLNSNQIRTIPTNAFEGLKEIIYIEIMNNEIATIEPNAFLGLLTLELLDLSGNRLRHLSATAVTGAMRLKFLHLDENALETIDDGALDLPAMEGIILRRNRLTAIPNGLCAASPKLRYAHWSMNRITAIANEFDQCRNLKILYFDNNQLETVNFTALATLGNLNILQLGYNRIRFPRTAPIVGGETTRSVLETLPIEFNHIADANIFQHIAVFRNIERISLRGNDFKSFNRPAEIFAMLPKLKQITLDRNADIEQWVDDNKSLLFDNEVAVVLI